MSKTQELEQRIAELNPDTMNWNDASAYAALGIGQGDDEDGHGEGQPEGDTIDTGEASPAPAPAAAAAAPAAPAPTESSASPAAAPAAPQSPGAEPVDGVATRDGKRIIPYAVLQQTRQAVRERDQEIEQLRQQLATATAKASPAGQNDLADRAAADPDSLTDDELQELEADFPQLAKPLRLLRKLTSAAPAALPASAPAAAPAAPTQPAAPAVDLSEEAFDEGIAANPLLAGWMSAGGKEWDRAKAVDQLLLQDPAYAAKGYTERFATVQRMVAAEFGIPLPAAPKTNDPKPGAPAPQVKESALPSLSDLGGAAPRSDDDAWAAAPTTDLLAKAERMSDAELMRLAGVSY
jgi:hypothetical protein